MGFFDSVGKRLNKAGTKAGQSLSKVGRSLNKGVSKIEEKNRRAAQLNRLRAVLKREEKAAQSEYLALGRYYYHSLRDKNDSIAESHAAELDIIEKRISVAVEKLEECYAEMAAERAVRDEEKQMNNLSLFAEKTEIDIDDVECFDSDPTEGTDEAEKLEDASVEIKPADEDENDYLPFE